MLAVPALAEEGRVDQVEALEIEAETLELEMQFVATGDEDARLLNTTIEYGLSDWIQIGFEIEAQSEDGEALIVESIAPQAKIIFIDPSSAQVGIGLQASAEIDTHGEGIGTEVFLIAEHRRPDYAMVGNLVFQTEPGNFGEVSLSYAARGDRRLSQWVAIGLELGGGIAGEGRSSHFAGPVLGLFLAEEGPAVELGVFAPLTEAAPGWQMRLEIDLEF